MILSRRRAHLYSSIALMSLLPLGFLIALFLRPQYQATQSPDVTLFEQAGFAALPDPETANEANSGPPIASTTLEAKGVQLQAQTFSLPDNPTAAIGLALQPATAIRRPDMLVYWAAAKSAAEGSATSAQDATEEKSAAIGENFILLGKLSGPSRRVFSLPPDSYGQEGRLILYSQVQQFQVAEFPFPANLTAIDR